MKTYRIALVPGDGIGKEVVPAGRRVLEALAAGRANLDLSSRRSLGAATTIARTGR